MGRVGGGYSSRSSFLHTTAALRGTGHSHPTNRHHPRCLDRVSSPAHPKEYRQTLRALLWPPHGWHRLRLFGGVGGGRRHCNTGESESSLRSGRQCIFWCISSVELGENTRIRRPSVDILLGAMETQKWNEEKCFVDRFHHSSAQISRPAIVCLCCLKYRRCGGARKKGNMTEVMTPVLSSIVFPPIHNAALCFGWYKKNLTRG